MQNPMTTCRRSDNLRTTHTRSRFTLVELLIAMFILSMILVLVMYILTMAQTITRHSKSVNEISESEKISIDLIERDFYTAIASSVPGREIGFYIGDPIIEEMPDPDNPSTTLAVDSLHFCLVTSTDSPDPTAKSHLAEVSYRFHRDPDAGGAIPPFTLTRQVVTDAPGVGGAPGNGYWDFLGRPLSPRPWWLNQGGPNPPPVFETVARGIADFSIKCFDIDGQEVPPDTDTTRMPARIEITLDTFDERLINAPESVRFETQHRTVKIINFGDLANN